MLVNLMMNGLDFYVIIHSSSHNTANAGISCNTVAAFPLNDLNVF